MQVPFSTRGQGSPVKWEDGAGGPGAAVRGCYWGISLTQPLLTGAQQHFHSRLHHQGRNGNDLKAVTPSQNQDGTSPMPPNLQLLPALWVQPVPMPPFSKPKDRDEQSHWSLWAASVKLCWQLCPSVAVIDVPWGQRSVPRMIPTWYGGEHAQSSPSTAVQLSGTGGQGAGPRVFLEDS